MLNSLTLRKSAKEIGINLKVAFRMESLFSFSTVIANINTLSSILLKSTKYFLLNPLKKIIISPIRKVKIQGGERDKNKK